MNKEVNTIATTNPNTKPVEPFNPNAFIAELQTVISLSPLAHGNKIDTEDIVNADHVVLTDVDIVDYTKGDNDNVHFAVWRVEVTKDGEYVEGYYQSGAVLTKVADHLVDNNQLENLREHGVVIAAKWGKTTSKNSILLVDIIGVER